MIAAPFTKGTIMFALTTTVIPINPSSQDTVLLMDAQVIILMRPLFNTTTAVLTIVQMAMTTRHKAAVTIATAPTIPCLLCMVLFHSLH